MQTKQKFLFTGLLVFILVVGITGVALAFDSGGNPADFPGDNTVQWTGQGAANGVLNTSQCDENNTQYLLWVFTTDGGSATITGSQALHLGGTGTGDFAPDTNTGNTFKFVTPYYTPDNSLTAYVDFTVATSGRGSWNLVISHGCAGGQEAEPPTVSKDAAGSYDDTFGWTISKSADTDTVYSAGGGESSAVNYTVTVSHGDSQVSNVKVTGNITVTNPNANDLLVDNIHDELSDGTFCSDLGPVNITPQGFNFSYGCNLAGLPDDDLTNTATITWSEQTLSDGSHLAAGSASFTTDPISFSGTEIDTCADVSDTLAGDLGQVCVGDDNPTKFEYPMTFTGDPAGTCTPHDNVASFTTNNTQTSGNSGTVTVRDCQGADLTATKDATPSFDLTYAWTIDKTVDKTSVKQVGGNATFNYTVSVSHDDGTASNWQVNGTITVSNPNDWQDITANLSDAIDNGGVCSVSPASVTVPALGNATASYTCTYASAPNPAAFTNTATATWEAAAYHTPNGSANGTASGAFGDPTNVYDECITVTDTFGGTLGTACVGDANPKTFTYSRAIAVTAGCHSYDNTATFTTNDTGATGLDGQTVEVCGPAQTGALTIGFWKTTNGQNLIKTYCANTLDDYLAGLGSGSGPFADAAGKNCSQLSTYVQSILSGASATNMNVMLKAQMMGTTLDVWFSGPGWTSTKISGVKPPSNFLSHNNLGTFNMDTTAVCPMVDNSSTGTATCLNSLPSTDAVASGAVPTSPMSMQAILNFAATTPSPFNGLTGSGSVWYGGNRTKQEILKNIFDQFNNQMAFGSF